ncbi:MAG: hypothetical protein AB8G22_08620, partial [Saprospiraceae bacterium]
MTPEQLIKNVFIAYENASRLACGNNDARIKRGKQYSISNILEDWFALYIADQFPDQDLSFLIDTNISTRLPDRKRMFQFRPDLLIEKNGVIT